MIGSAGALREAVERAARDAPGAAHLFELGEGLGRVVLRDLPLHGRCVFRGGSIHSLAARNCGSMIFDDVRFFGAQAAETWGPRLHQVRLAADADFAFFGCRFEGAGAPWERPEGALIDAARRVRFQGCAFRGLFNGAGVASVRHVEWLGCDFRGIIGDAMHLRNMIPALAPRIAVTLRDNLVAEAAEDEPVHPDALQVTSTVPVRVDIARNVFWSPGRSFQGLLLQNAGGSEAPVSGRIVQNHMLLRHANAIYAWRPGGLFVAANVVATECSRDPGPSAARIHAQAPGMTAQGNVTFRLSGPVLDAGGNRTTPRGAYAGRLRGPWRAGEWGDVLAAPPPPGAPAAAVKAALRRALQPI